MLNRELPIEQVGFRKNRNFSDQVLVFTTYVENDFQSKDKSGTVFLDLSSAHDTVWKKGLLLKLAKIVKCKKTLRLMESILSNRKYKMLLSEKPRRYKYLQNSLPQSSILFPLQFNIYITDIIETEPRKCMYAEDIALVSQKKTFATVENILNEDLNILNTRIFQQVTRYFKLRYDSTSSSK